MRSLVRFVLAAGVGFAAATATALALPWMLILALAVTSAAGCGFVAGSGYEYGRPGGTSDLQDRLKALARLRAALDRNPR